MGKTRLLKNCIFTLAVLISCLLFTACDTAAQRKQNAENEVRGQKNAIAYIEQKYGFTPTIKLTEIDRIPGGYGGRATSNVLVTMEHDGREFLTFISGLSDNTDGADTYQQEEIFEAFKKALNEKLPGLVSIEYYPADRIQSDKVTSVFSPKYDGTNLKEVLNDGLAGFDLGYVNLDLDNTEQFAFLDELITVKNCEISIVSLRENALEVEEDDLSYLKEHAVTSYGYRDLSTGKCFKYDYKNYNNELWYCAMPDENGKCANLTLTEGDYGNLRDFAHTQTEVITPLTKAYTVSADAWVQNVEFYYPVEDLSYQARQHKCFVRRLEYSDGTVKTDRMFWVAANGGKLRIIITVPDNCKVTFGVLDIVEPKTTP